MSNDSISEGTRFAEERTRPQSIETEMINSLISSESLEQVKRKLREQKERDAKREASLKAREAERTAVAAAYAKEAAPESTRASPAAIKLARAKAAAETAGGVFLEDQDHNSLLSRIRLLEAEVANLACAGIESPQVKVEPDKSLSPSSFNKASLSRTLPPSLLRANSFGHHAMLSSDISLDTPKILNV